MHEVVKLIEVEADRPMLDDHPSSNHGLVRLLADHQVE
jgi:hypothetical protein